MGPDRRPHFFAIATVPEVLFRFLADSDSIAVPHFRGAQ
jgi:hypothetical protein